MDEKLIISDEYVSAVGSNCDQRGELWGDMLEQYIEILDEIRNEAIVSGDIALALSQFIGCAKMLQGEIEKVSSSMKRVCNCMLERIDEADQYLF